MNWDPKCVWEKANKTCIVNRIKSEEEEEEEEEEERYGGT